MNYYLDRSQIYFGVPWKFDLFTVAVASAPSASRPRHRRRVAAAVAAVVVYDFHDPPTPLAVEGVGGHCVLSLFKEFSPSRCEVVINVRLGQRVFSFW